MVKKFFEKLSIILLLSIIMITSFILTSNVNASDTVSNEKQKVAPNMSFSGVIPNNLEEEKIMEYDASTGITREVDMDELRQNLATKTTRNGGYSDRVEPYDPLAEDTDSDNISTRAIFNPVYDTTPLPNRAICRIKAEVYGDELVASGYLAGPNVVVTAAHCVMNRDDGDNFFAQWAAYPGYYNGNSYKGVSTGWTKIYYSSDWKSTHSPAYDWCICILGSDIGNTTGWLGTQSYGSNTEMNGVSVRLFGYPLDGTRGEQQMYSNGTISNTQDFYFDSSAVTIGGFSGGPFLRTSDDYVVGVCHGYWTASPYTSIGVRITQEMIDIINSYR